MGLKMMTDGSIYFVYNELHEPNLNIVKMDKDLNVEWERFCKTSDIIIYSAFACSKMDKEMKKA